MDDAEYALRKEIIATCLLMDRRGLNQGTSGNISVRWQDGLLITPTSLPYETMAPDDIVRVAWDGTAEGRHAPSSEWRFHRDILRTRPDLDAVVHAHPAHLTALSMLRREIPAVHYMIAAAGGSTIRCADYATYGTAELSANVLKALEGRTGCILANHGAIASARTLRRAVWLLEEMEVLARQLILARQAGTPVVLPDDEIERVARKFKGYGLQDGAIVSEAGAPASLPDGRQTAGT